MEHIRLEQLISVFLLIAINFLQIRGLITLFPKWFIKVFFISAYFKFSIQTF